MKSSGNFETIKSNPFDNLLNNGFSKLPDNIKKNIAKIILGKDHGKKERINPDKITKKSGYVEY